MLAYGMDGKAFLSWTGDPSPHFSITVRARLPSPGCERGLVDGVPDRYPQWLISTVLNLSDFLVKEGKYGFYVTRTKLRL